MSESLFSGLCSSMTQYSNPNLLTLTPLLTYPNPIRLWILFNFGVCRLTESSPSQMSKSLFSCLCRSMTWYPNPNPNSNPTPNSIRRWILFNFVSFYVTRAFDSGSGLTRTRIWLGTQPLRVQSDQVSNERNPLTYIYTWGRLFKSQLA